MKNQIREIYYCHSYVHLSLQLKYMIFHNKYINLHFSLSKSIRDRLPVGLIAQLIEDCTGTCIVRLRKSEIGIFKSKESKWILHFFTKQTNPRFSDDEASKEPKSPLPEWILRFL